MGPEMPLGTAVCFRTASDACAGPLLSCSAPTATAYRTTSPIDFPCRLPGRARFAPDLALPTTLGRAPPDGLEPPTRTLGRCRSIQLSYGGETSSYPRVAAPSVGGKRRSSVSWG